ncbi:MAG TPA: hypothetical protein VG387_20815 [Rhizomicrobium sp.]|jgi:hypothetical protein|nr:hypothetical protein [Rhizomicrobium sp.]
MSKEHLYANWLGKHIPSRVDEHGINFTLVAPKSSSHFTKMRSGDSHARKIRRVCAICNKGWMSRLQEATKPYLLPLIEGRRTILSRKGQKAIAVWAAMTVMTGEFLDDSEEFVAISQSDRDHLRTEHRVPFGWRIWIGCYRWREGVNRWTHHVMCFGEKGDGSRPGDMSVPQNTQTTTICIGDNLFIHVMSSSAPSGEHIIRRWGFPKAISPALAQIHPTVSHGIRWPSAFELKAGALYYVANTFFDRCSTLLMIQAS